MKVIKWIKILVMFIIISVIVSNNKVLADSKPVVKRLEGKNRVETSIEISKEAFERSKTVVIVGYNGEVDALTGTILAEDRKAPILISGKEGLHQSLKDELKRLGCEEVFIVGGYKVVEKSTEDEIRSLGLKVERIKGDSREETAIKIAEKSIVGKVERAFLSLGYGVYADALAIGPIAANENVPLLLTKTDKLGSYTLEYIERLGIQEVTIIGGEKAVGVKVENILKDKGIKTNRINGNSREETAVKIAEEFIVDPQKVFVANGYKYADAVAGGYLAAKENSPILLSNSKELKDINKTYIEEKNRYHYIGRKFIDR